MDSVTESQREATIMLICLDPESASISFHIQRIYGKHLKKTHLSDQGAQFSHHYAQPFFLEWALQKPENNTS